ncbi:MAG: hypothetical protein JOZ33_11750 [Acidobacteriaceae bacterium]|nr:hypothetical protein [Acidobacteriaceae bacterium]
MFHQTPAARIPIILIFPAVRRVGADAHLNLFLLIDGLLVEYSIVPRLFCPNGALLAAC